MLGATIAAISALAATVVLILPLEHDDSGGGRPTRPIDPRQQTAVGFGKRSHWLQPWRAYLDTVPAVRLRDAIGINFNVEPNEARQTARLLARGGFRRARVEVGWSEIDYSDPTRLEHPSRMAALLGALRDQNIRPLILLNANHGRPTPARDVLLRLTHAAPRGARALHLDRPSARAVVPGRTGIDDSDVKAADVVVTRVASDGTAMLSKPLPRDLRAGRHEATTLRYPPFGSPRLADGTPNPAFERTLEGWLEYVGAVTREARRILGDQRFDVEVWNELSFGSDFLYQERYYDPPRERGKGEVTREILQRTVAYLRDPAHGVERIGIGNGFASQSPFAAGSTSPRGLTAIDKHPYPPGVRFPRDAVFDSIVPLDADGRPSFTERLGRSEEPIRRDRFVPAYVSFFPEYDLSAIQTETLVRELSPITTEVYGTPHGRRTHPRGGSAPTIWITETNLDPSAAEPDDPDGDGRRRTAALSPEQISRLRAKAALRYFTAYVNKGVSALYIFAVKDANLGIVDPQEQGGGEAVRAVGRLASALGGAERLARPRRLSLLEISEKHGHMQFNGDGTSEHPPLYDRDVVAFFPFAVRDGEYLAAAYVMTRNLARVYDAAGNASRYDLPEERFRLSIGGLAGRATKVSASDPLTGRTVPVDVERRTRNGLTVELPLTDSPRLLRFLARR